jgi:hypothetical protein
MKQGSNASLLVTNGQMLTKNAKFNNVFEEKIQSQIIPTLKP